MTSFFDLAADNAQQSWRRVRTFRASASARLESTLSRDRVDVFHMALEQSQQQFLAAAAIGYESRPLNLFYGLAQAGRAIAAASPRLGQQAPEPRAVWLASGGHGLKFNPRLSPSDGLQGQLVKVESNSTDSYSRFAHALDSPLDTGVVSVGALFAQTPEVYLRFGEQGWGAPPLLPNSVSGVDVTMATQAIEWDVTAPLGPPLDQSTMEDVAAWRDLYPALEGMEIAADLDGKPVNPYHPKHVRLLADPGMFVPVDGFEYLPTGVQLYRGSHVVLPRVGRSNRALHPLAIWWLQLYALSMLARYSPRDWTNVLSLRRGLIASTVEFVLDVAIDAVPNLIAESLESLDSDQ